jgi:hypothetical protein
MTLASEPQPAPEPGQKIVRDFVLKAILERAAVGKVRYGTYLMTHNGRDALVDAFQEAIDLTMYLAQAIMERDT